MKTPIKKGERPPKVSIFERLCIFFAYYRDGRTIADIANEYSIAESTTFDIICLVEDSLLKISSAFQTCLRYRYCNS